MKRAASTAFAPPPPPPPRPNAWMPTVIGPVIAALLKRSSSIVFDWPTGTVMPFVVPMVSEIVVGQHAGSR